MATTAIVVAGAATATTATATTATRALIQCISYYTTTP